MLFSATAALTTILAALALSGHFGTRLAGLWIVLLGDDLLRADCHPANDCLSHRGATGTRTATSLYVMAFNTSIAAGALAGALTTNNVSTTPPILIGALLCAMATATTLAIHTHTNPAPPPQ